MPEELTVTDYSRPRRSWRRRACARPSRRPAARPTSRRHPRRRRNPSRRPPRAGSIATLRTGSDPMAMTQADLSSIEEAIATGALKVRFADNREVTYRSLARCARSATRSPRRSAPSRRRCAPPTPASAESDPCRAPRRRSGRSPGLPRGPAVRRAQALGVVTEGGRMMAPGWAGGATASRPAPAPPTSRSARLWPAFATALATSCATRARDPTRSRCARPTRSAPASPSSPTTDPTGSTTRSATFGTNGVRPPTSPGQHVRRLQRLGWLSMLEGGDALVRRITPRDRTGMRRVRSS